MKLARFELKGQEHIGRVDGEKIIDLKGTLIYGHEETGIQYVLSEVRLLPPVTPTKVVCVSRNYRGLIEQLNESVPEEPVICLKPPSCLIGHESEIIYPSSAGRVIFEGELAIVIKDKIKNVSTEEALDHVFGYCCFNDVCDHAMVKKNHLLLNLAKGFDTFGPIGPYLETDLDPNKLELRTFLNGKLMQNDNTQNCIFSMQYIIHYVSTFATLYPGDVISTGTPAGFAPMKPGDVVEVEIEGIGRLRNTVVSL